MQAQLIAVEGIEGAGKSTVIKLIEQFLLGSGIQQVLLTREPGGSAMGEKIRDILIHADDDAYFSPYSELLLFYAGRIQHLENVIKPALTAGRWVISDRFELSSYAYQGGGRQVPRSFIDSISQQVMQGIKADLTIYLDISPEEGMQRACQRGELDRIEQENIEFFARARQTYLQFAKMDDSIVVIDAAQSPMMVKQDLLAHLQQRYQQL